MTHFLKLTLDTIFPSQCLICKKKLEDQTLKVICRNCFEKIEINSGFTCPRCKKRLYEPKNDCHPETKFVLGAASFFENKIVRELIHALKYKNLKSAIEPLSRVLELYLNKAIKNSDFKIENFIIVPVPLHKKKERMRGFNQAQLLAQKLSFFLNKTPIAENSLIKIKNTKSQTELKNSTERKENIKNSFGVKDPNQIQNKNIFLLDDVFTSGATMQEATTTLKAAGAKKIIGLVIART